MSDRALAGLAESLLDIGNGGKTGVLRTGAGGRLRMGFFEGGALVYVVSDVPEENLAVCFARAGRFERAHERLELFQLEREVTRKKTLVSLVLERGLRDADTLRAWLVEYAYEVFARTFDARDVTFKFMPGVKAEHPLAFAVPAVELVLEAVRGMRDDDAIHEALGPMSWTTRPVAGEAARLESLPLSFYEGLVAARVTEPISLDHLVAVSGIPEADALRAILALRLVGAIAPFAAPKGLTDSGRLRMRRAALESGFTLDADSAAAGAGFSGAIVDEPGGDGAVTMGEFDGTTAFVAPPRPRGSSAPLVYPPPRPRGDSSRLRLLASAYIQMGEAEAAAGNYGAAAQCFESALAQKPDDLETMLAYARLHAKRQNGFAAAEKLLEQACDAHPKAASPFVALARLYRDAGRMDEAEEALAEARRLEPGNAEVRAMVDGLGKKGGGLLSRLGFRSESKPPAAAGPAARPPSASAPPAAAPAEEVEPRLYCRYCGQAVRGEARICRSCGATL
jgi:tetratricopeptide (TPR) repeat protein